MFAFLCEEKFGSNLFTPTYLQEGKKTMSSLIYLLLKKKKLFFIIYNSCNNRVEGFNPLTSQLEVLRSVN